MYVFYSPPTFYFLFFLLFFCLINENQNYIKKISPGTDLNTSGTQKMQSIH